MMHFVMSLALFFHVSGSNIVWRVQGQLSPGKPGWDAGKTGDERARSGKESNKMQLP